MHPLIEWSAAALIVIAAFFLLVGAIGLARLPDFFMRLHAPTKASTLGVAAVTVAVVLCAWRLLRGPEMTDRLLALDTLYMNAVALIVLLGIRWNTALLFEAALLVAMLGFASTVALARYLSRGDVVE